jgi:sialic acid synthase
MARSMIINGITINDASDAYVIAEIGHNHQGSVEQAKEMITAAKLAGATAVKLQKRDNRALYTDAFYNKPYENENSFGTTYGEHRE